MRGQSVAQTLLTAAVCLCILLTGSCGGRAPGKLDADLVLARFDDNVVTARDLITIILERNQLENLLRLSLEEGKVAEEIRKTLPGIVYRKVVAAMARADRLDATDSYRQWRSGIIDRKLGQLVLDVDTILKVNVTDRDVQRYYRENPSEFTLPETYQFRGIVCLDEKWGGREGAREHLQKALARLQAGEDFVQVAQEYSDSAAHLRGQPQGPIARGEGLPVEIEEVLLSLSPGDCTGIVEGGKGVAIYQLMDRTEAQNKELVPGLRWEIQSKIFENRRRREEQILVAQLVERDAITYRPEMLNDPTIPDASVALEVHGFPPVTIEELRKEMGPADKMTTVERREFFEARAASLLLLSEAHRRGYAEEDVDARVEYYEGRELEDRYLHSLLDQDEVTIEDLRNYYESHRTEFVTEREYKLYRIFISAQIREHMSRLQRLSALDSARSVAQAVYDRIAAEGIPFQDAAREYSSDTVTAAEGGYVGQVSLSRLGRDFATLFDIASQLEPGLVTPPQIANFHEDHLGCDLYFCAQVEPSQALTFEEALPKIGKQLAENRRKERYSELWKEVLETHPLTVDDKAVEHLAQILSEIRRSSPTGADLIKALLPRSRLRKLGL
jgi:parvulin-like peptidyl-prolyl isomerase